MTVLQGATYPAQVTASTDLTGATVVLTVTAPDGTVTTPNPTVTGATATANIVGSQVGDYLLVWTITAAGGYKQAADDQFHVRPAVINLVDIGDLRSELHIKAGDTSKQEWLLRQMDAATGVIENVTGSILPRTRVDIFTGSPTVIVLPERWVTSITSVLETYGYGTTALTEQTFGAGYPATYGYVWERTTNLLRRTGLSRFQGDVQVTYTAGLASIPYDIQLAAVELIRHWYRKTQSGGGASYGNGDDDPSAVGNYMVPNAVMELLGPYRRPPGIA